MDFGGIVFVLGGNVDSGDCDFPIVELIISGCGFCT